MTEVQPKPIVIIPKDDRPVVLVDRDGKPLLVKAAKSVGFSKP